MNRNGQALVIFVILIPIIALVMTLVLDLGNVNKEKIKITNTLTTIIEDVLNKESDNKEELVKELIKLNEIKYDELNINYDESLNINLTKDIKSVLGSFIKIDIYRVKISLTGSINNGKLTIEKG